jgi:hypothetical protein
MALNFPTSPALGEVYSSPQRAWRWNGEAWAIVTPGGTSLEFTETTDFTRLNIVTPLSYIHTP